MLPFLVLALASGATLIGIGVWIERRPPAAPVIQPITPSISVEGVTPGQRVRQIAARHPRPLYAVLETGAWLLIALTVVDHLRDPRDGPVAFVIWALAIGPHEIGHFICLPFGWFLNVAGGSIWQLLIFILPAVFALTVRKQISGALLFWALTGHSLINLAQYIGDARARKLPLIFGMSKDHHDWWNLLRDVGLLQYDHLFAALATGTGVALIAGAAALGIVTAWAVPRTRLGPAARYEGSLWSALRDGLRAETTEEKREKNCGEIVLSGRNEESAKQWTD